MSRRTAAALASLLVSCGFGTRAPAPRPAEPVDDEPEAAATSAMAAYAEAATRIIEAARAPVMIDDGRDRLQHLTDKIGARLAGSAALDDAIAWAAQVMTADGHDVRREKVMVPRWVRGAESGRITAPVERELALLGLGGTIATPRGGLTGSVVVVTSWEDLIARADQVKGKIVLYDVAMPAWSEEHGSGYGDVVGYRWAGAAQAAKLGAIGALVRSVTAHSLRTPHTGSMGYEEGVTKIPTAAISVEDAELIHRLVDDGEEVKLELVLSAKQHADVESANVIGELRGRELPDEVVVIAAHLDSWDVGQGAHDDGGGCVAVMQALRILRQLGLTPRRTVRVVLYTNEENGLRGATGYADAHAAELGQHVMALETDMGSFAPRGFWIDDGLEEEARQAEGGARQARIQRRVAEIAALLEPLGATRTEPGHGGSDIAPLAAAGVPALGLWTDNRTYFDIHHTAADTFEKVDPAMISDDAAAIAVIAYVVAEMPGRLDDP